jgi:3-oxoadipate enol-lactonase / 4-carboxymuconolactone decarboxylase
MFIQYTVQGLADQPALVFSNSLGADTSMWEEVASLLSPHFRVIRYALAVEATGDAIPYSTSPEPTLAWFSGTVLALLDHLSVEKAFFCGLSMGGMIGQWLGVHHSERLNALVLCNTAAKIGTADTWNTRIETVQQQGLEAIVDGTMERWFTDGFRQRQPERVNRVRSAFVRSNPSLYLMACAALRDADFRADLAKITVPVLVIGGTEDPVTTLEQADFLVQQIPGAQLAPLPTRHLSATENPTDFARLITTLFSTSSFSQ